MEDHQERYQRAAKLVQEQSQFYMHLFIYLVVNLIVQLIYWGVIDVWNISLEMPWWGKFMMPTFWGISLTIHYFMAFKPNLIRNNVIKRWEDRKIQEFMKEDEEAFNSRFGENISK